MSLSAKIREQLISSFRAELAEHVQTMSDGLLALEQNRVSAEQRTPLLEEILRAAHSLKGAARAIGVTAVEQLSHALEDVLVVLQDSDFVPTPDFFTACYAALDAILAVQSAYESGETTPPTQSLRALNDLEPFKPANPRSFVSQSAHASPPVETMRGPDTPADERTAAPGEAGQRERVGARTAMDSPNLSLQGAAAGADETIRVGVNKLDTLMAQLSELLVTRIRAEERRVQIRTTRNFINEWQRDWLAVRSLYARLARRQRQSGADGAVASLDHDLVRLMSYLEANQDRLRELSAQVTSLSREYDSDMMHTSLVVDALEEQIKRVRVLPLHTITTSFGRMVRDVAQSAGKEAVLQIVGADVELDKRVLEQIKDPLVHLLRNAIDHGIEASRARQAAGKPSRGSIVLHAAQLGKDVVITVSDDGAGLDIASIRQIAARRTGGIRDPYALSERELADMVFDSGFSTTPIITDISGRGVGLDIVRRNVEMLGGNVRVEWVVGGGTTFILTVPMTVTSSRALLVLVSGQVYAIPLTAVDRILYLSPDRIVPLGGRDSVYDRGRPVPVVRMADVLGLEDPGREEDHISVMILAVGERRIGFVVDEFVGEQEAVIKELGKQLSRVCGVAGATVMGSGDVVLILNPGDLMKMAFKDTRRSVLRNTATASRSEGVVAPQRILIVDDSVTTRTLEKNILEAAGFDIRIATDGQEALNAIAAYGVPDLIISDVSMPKLDGFGLTERIKSDPRTAEVPVILVTSLDSVEDKSRGIEVGADAYIVKGRFDQSNLLETIKQLI
jgi:two-component system, chemotaxis family, sensor kinase CheA